MTRLRLRVEVVGIASVLAFAIGACSERASGWDWNRMRSQPRANDFGASSVFANGSAMRSPPAGVVSRDAMIGDERPSGVDLARGASRFRIFCAVCHGDRGDGNSIVGSNMDDPKPPTLLEGAARQLPPEKLFDVITNGFGTMPSYGAELSAQDRWQVVSYVAAPQRRAAADSDTLNAVPLVSRP